MQPGKGGLQNGLAINERSEAIGLSESVECAARGAVSPPHSCAAGCTYEHGTKVHTRMTHMTVDKAGGKTTRYLRRLGLIFVTICECHCLAVVAGPSGFNLGFGKPKQASLIMVLYHSCTHICAT